MYLFLDPRLLLFPAKRTSSETIFIEFLERLNRWAILEGTSNGKHTFLISKRYLKTLVNFPHSTYPPNYHGTLKDYWDFFSLEGRIPRNKYEDALSKLFNPGAILKIEDLKLGQLDNSKIRVISAQVQPVDFVLAQKAESLQHSILPPHFVRSLAYLTMLVCEAEKIEHSQLRIVTNPFSFDGGDLSSIEVEGRLRLFYQYTDDTEVKSCQTDFILATDPEHIRLLEREQQKQKILTAGTRIMIAGGMPLMNASLAETAQENNLDLHFVAQEKGDENKVDQFVKQLRGYNALIIVSSLISHSISTPLTGEARKQNIPVYYASGLSTIKKEIEKILKKRIAQATAN